MSEKITFKYESGESEYADDIIGTIVMTFESEGMTMYDLADRMKQFALAIGYLPGSVDRVFKDDDEE